jgi:PPM family protein phosphatase
MSATSKPIGELYEIASCTHAGAVREVNEDYCATFTTDDCAGLVVADGVSSFNGGDTASRVAVEVTVATFLAGDAAQSLAKRLYRAVQRANIAVHDQALDVPELRSMATTLTAVVLSQGELVAAHIGDCRLYLSRGERFRQLTRDHTVSAERSRLGVLSKARAKNHPGRSTLTRCLGRDLMARVDQIQLRLFGRDVLVVCSDGIHAVLDDPDIAQLSRAVSASQACQDLVDAANHRGSPDNVTAAVVRISDALPVPRRATGPFGALWRRFSTPG